MISQTYISKKKPDQKSLDFELLRSEGIKHISDLAGKVWNNHNKPDPGITILEVLCYAITDLGNRTQSSIPDILAEQNGANSIFEDSTLWHPHEILPCSPLTVSDFRKVLIDQDKIKNAWLEVANQSELEFFADNKNKTLSYSTGSSIELNGLYEVLVEFEDDNGSEDNEGLGDLNSSILKRTIDVSGTEVIIEVAFPFWDEMPPQWRSSLDIEEIRLLETPGVPGEKLRALPNSDDYFTVIEVIYNGAQSYKLGVRIIATGPGSPYSEAELIDAIVNAIEITPAEIAWDSSILDNSLVVIFNKKIIEAYAIINEMKLLLNNYRVLCEDFINFKAVRIQEVSIKADIEIFVESNKEAVIAEILLAVDRFISPSTYIYSLGEMLDKGFSPDQIFEGPLLTNGFIDTNELNKQETDVFYTSDILKLILDQNGHLQIRYNNGIVAVSNMLLSNYINNQPLSVNNRNCLKLTQSKLYKPRFSIEKSEIRILKDHNEIAYNFSDVVDAFYALKLEPAEIVEPTTTGLPEISSNHLGISSYKTLQNDFPKIYGIGQAGIPGSLSHLTVEASNARIAQAKQLKAYLIFFEQLLANYLAQLSNISNLFSIASGQDKSYFYQPLYDIPGVGELLGSFPNSGESWENFMNNPENNYQSRLNSLSNTTSVYQSRRDRLLEHLIARFSESFIEYGLIQKAKSADLSSLLSTKIRFLSDYPEISRNRAKAFNYLKMNGALPDVWDTPNVSGLEKRLCRMLGIKSFYRRNLVNPVSSFFEIYDELDTDGIMKERFRVKDTSGNILLSSSLGYTDTNVMNNEILEVIKYAPEELNYRIIIGSDDKFYFSLVDNTEEIIARRIVPFDTVEEARFEIAKVASFMTYYYEGEGLYLIEHILLRPRFRNIEALPSPDLVSHDFLLLNEVDDYTVEPYSFTISVVLPSGHSETEPPGHEYPERFTDPDFRSYAEKVIRKEVPAHIMVDIHWLDVEQLSVFQELYQNWLLVFCNPASTQLEIVLAQNELVSALNDLKAG